MKTLIRKHFSAAAMFFMLLLPVFSGCDPFQQDGITSPDEIAKKGYFYIADRGSNSLIMLDYGMHELTRWSLNKFSTDSSALQGISFKDTNVWLAYSGNVKSIFRINASSSELAATRTIHVPPYVSGSTQGTVRGIAFNDSLLWVVNSGSGTKYLAPTLYKYSLNSDSVFSSYTIPAASPRGITYAGISADAYGKGPATGLYFLDNESKYVYYFNTAVPFFSQSFAAPVPPAGTTWDQTLGITNDGESFYTLSYSDLASYLFKTSYLGEVGFSYKLPYKYPIGVVWANYDIRTYIPEPFVPLTVTGISPSSGAQGQAVSAYISGTGFKDSTGLSVNLGSGITVDTLKYVSSTSLYVHLNIDAGATVGKRDVVVTNPNGTTSTGTSMFEVSSVPMTEYLFETDFSDNKFYQVRISDKSIIQTISTASISTGQPKGLAYDGANLYIACGSPDFSIYKITASGGVITTSTTIKCSYITRTLHSLTYYNNALWVLASNSSAGVVYKIDASTGNFLDSLYAYSPNSRGIAFMHDSLLCNDGSGKVYACDPSVKIWSVSPSFEITGTPVAGGKVALTGMFNAGSSLWLANSGGTGSADDALMETTFSGSLIRYVSAPNAGAGKPSGIVYCKLKDN